MILNDSLSAVNSIVSIVTGIFTVVAALLAIAVGWYTKVVVRDAKEDILKAVKESYVSREQQETFRTEVAGKVALLDHRVGDVEGAVGALQAHGK